nr:magnesium transporter [Saprospiraceae bacterium]
MADHRLERELKLSEEIESGRVEEFLPILQQLPTIEVAEILSEISEEKMLEVMPLFTREQQAQVFSDLDFDLQYLLFNSLDRWHFANIFEWVPSEIRADFFQEISREEQIQLLPYLIKSVRKDVIELSKYPPETAGGIMSTDFATVLENMTSTEAIAKVRSDAPSKKMIYYIYVVDEDMMMKGFITLKDLILAEPHQLVSEILHLEYVHAEVEEDRELVAQKIEKYDLVAIPVLNQRRQLVGIVTHDEAIEVIRAEQTEDMEKFMGIVPDGEDLDYLETTSFQHYKKRAAWLVSLAALGIVS